ncbi:hypothetical protein QYM36_006462, partial [Artemia franciscana]
MKNACYHKADKAIKKSTRNDHQTLIKNKAKLAEKAAKSGDSRVLYQIISDIVEKGHTVSDPVQDPSGVLVTKPAAVNELWVCHFKRLLNGPPPTEPPNIPATPFFSLNISMEPQSATEIQAASNKLKNDDNPILSSSQNVISRVPQGSVLGPTMFNISINDVLLALKSRMTLYADDSKVIGPATNLEDASQLQKDLDLLSMMWNFNIQCWIFGIILLCPTIPAKKPPLAQFFPDAVPLDKSRGDPGDPLYLTPYIKSGNIAEGQKLAKVEGLSQVVSYSGLLTVNASCNSNMFFWFFPAAYSPETAPVILWLQGGPGGSSMFGLFVEHGPFSVDKNMNLQFRPEAWSLTNSMLYIDNPVGTGFSFTQNDYCYANNQQDVARDLYEGLSQFFLLFPQHRERDFYVTGESYA